MKCPMKRNYYAREELKKSLPTQNNFLLLFFINVFGQNVKMGLTEGLFLHKQITARICLRVFEIIFLCFRVHIVFPK